MVYLTKVVKHAQSMGNVIFGYPPSDEAVVKSMFRKAGAPLANEDA